MPKYFLNQPAYIVELSNKRSVQIDPDEVEKVFESVKTGNPVRVRQGLINPSFFIDMVLDDKRISDVNAEKNKIQKHNDFQKLSRGKDFQVFNGMSPLDDIFARIPSLRKPERSGELMSGN